MEARSGTIYRSEDLEHAERVRGKLLALTEEQANTMAPMSKNQRKNNMRNKPCICGSAKKFKKCCWNKYL